MRSTYVLRLSLPDEIDPQPQRLLQSALVQQ